MTMDELNKLSGDIKGMLPEQIGTDELAFIVGMIILEYSPDKDAAAFHLGKASGT